MRRSLDGTRASVGFGQKHKLASPKIFHGRVFPSVSAKSFPRFQRSSLLPVKGKDC